MVAVLALSVGAFGATLPDQSSADAAPLFARAVQLQRSGDVLGAIAVYEDILARSPERTDARSNLGAAYARLGRYDDAIAQYRRALAVADAPAVRFNLALALYKSARVEDAAVELARVASTQPDNLSAALLLAECRLQLGRDDEVVALLTPFEGRPGENRAFAYVLGTALIRTGDHKRGQVVIDRIFRSGESAEGRMLMGSAHLEAGDYREAAQDLERSIRLNPKLPGVHSLHGRALLRSGGRNEALQAFRTELELNPNDFEANLQLGRLKKDDHEYEEALAYLTRARRLRPQDPSALYVQATVYAALQRNDAALDALQKVVAEAPTFAQAHVLIATVYYRFQRKDDGDRHRAIALKLEAEAQAKAPGAREDLGPGYRGDEPLPHRQRPRKPEKEPDA